MLVMIVLLWPMAALAEQVAQSSDNMLAFAGKDIYGASLLVLKYTDDDETKCERIAATLEGYPESANASDKATLLALALELASTIIDDQDRANTLWSIAEFGANNNCLDKAAIYDEMATIANPEAHPYIVFSFSKVYQFLGENDKAFNLIDKYTAEYLKQPKDDIDWDIVTSLLEEYSLLGKYEQALTMALKYFTEDDLSNLIDQIFTDATDAGNLDAAIKLVQQLKDKDYIDSAWYSIAQGYAKKGDLANVLQSISKIKSEDVRGSALAVLGSNYKPDADYPKVIKAAGEIEWPYDFVYLLSFVSTYYHADYKEAAKAVVAKIQQIVDEQKVSTDIVFADYLAQTYLDIEDKATAIKTLEKIVLPAPKSANNEFEEYQTSFYNFYDIAENDAAKVLLAKFVDWASKIKSDKARVPLLTEIADFYWQSEDAKKASELYKEALDLAKKVKDSELLMDTYLSYIDFSIQQKQAATAQELLNGAMEVFKSMKGKYGVDELLYSVIDAGDLSKYQEVVKFKEEYNMEDTVDDLINLAQGAEDLGNKELALQILQNALKIDNLEAGQRDQFLSAIAQEYYKLGQSEKVKPTLGQIEDEEVKADTITSIAYYAPEGEESKAIVLCLELLKVLEDPSQIDNSLVKLINSATSYKGGFTQAFEILQQISDPLYLSDALSNIAGAYAQEEAPLNETMQRCLAEVLQKVVNK